jgi:Lipoprotein LpqB beta-propeller domain
VFAWETIQASTISPDSKQLAVVHKRWTLTIHDVTDGTDIVIFEKLDSSICFPTFSHDGSMFAAVVADRVIHVWDTITRNLLRKSQQYSADIKSLALSPDGTRIIAICRNSFEITVQIWLVTEDLTITLDEHKNIARSVAFIPDGMRFLTSSEQNTRIWNMPSTIPVLVSTLTSDSSSSGWGHISISSDGARLISHECLWDLINDRQITSLRNYISDAKFSPDCKLVAFRVLSDLHILDATTGAELYKPHPLMIESYSRSLSHSHSYSHPLSHSHSHSVSSPYSHSYPHSYSVSFSLDSTRLLLSLYGPAQVLDLRSLPTSVGTESLSCVYPPDCMMIQSQLRPEEDKGWYYGANDARLIWLPHNTGPVWLATGKQPLGAHCLFLGSGSDVAVLDVDDYLEMLPAGVAWREAGVRYVNNPEPFDTLMSKSGNKV